MILHPIINLAGGDIYDQLAELDRVGGRLILLVANPEIKAWSPAIGNPTRKLLRSN